MEGQLFNVYLAVCEGHKKYIRNIKTEREVDKELHSTLLCGVALIFKQEQNGDRDGKSQRDLEKVPPAEKGEYLAAFFVGKKFV